MARSLTHLRSLAAQLSCPTGRAIALMQAIEKGTTQSLSDSDLVAEADRALHPGRTSTTSTTSRRASYRSRGMN